jgi:hypothetical protein
MARAKGTQIATKILMVILISGIFSGCVLMGSYRVYVRRECISGSGSASRNHDHDQLRVVTINLTDAKGDVWDDIWIELSPGEKTSIGSITRTLLMEHQAKHENNCSDCFFFGRLTFEFNGEILKKVDADWGVTPAAKKGFNPRIGSVHRGASLTLPCTIPQFESVFGECDKVWRDYDYDTM